MPGKSSLRKGHPAREVFYDPHDTVGVGCRDEGTSSGSLLLSGETWIQGYRPCSASPTSNWPPSPWLLSA